MYYSKYHCFVLLGLYHLSPILISLVANCLGINNIDFSHLPLKAAVVLLA